VQYFLLPSCQLTINQQCQKLKERITTQHVEENSLTVLIQQHPNADAVHVEPVEEILDVVLDVRRDLRAGITFHLQDSLRHRLHHRRVPISNGL